MSETRAVGRLPSLEIEVRHRKVPEENAEYVAVTLKAVPDMDTAAAWLTPWRMTQAMLAMNPFLAWAAAVNPFMAAMLRPPSPAPRDTHVQPQQPAPERPRSGSNGQAHLN